MGFWDRILRRQKTPNIPERELSDEEHGKLVLDFITGGGPEHFRQLTEKYVLSQMGISPRLLDDSAIDALAAKYAELKGRKVCLFYDRSETGRGQLARILWRIMTKAEAELLKEEGIEPET